jgi:hypothetical protein
VIFCAIRSRRTFAPNRDNSAAICFDKGTPYYGVKRNDEHGATGRKIQSTVGRVASASEEPSGSQALQFANWITEKAISGVAPLSSAEDLANEYLIDSSYPHNDDRVWSLINWETSKNFTSGFVTGLGGLLTLPIAIPSAFDASWIIQARMSAAIAIIHGHSLRSDRVRTFVLVSLLGDAGKEVLKRAGIRVAQKLGENLIKRVPGRLLIEINKKVGFRLITKAGQTGVVNLMKGAPVIGGVVDATLCRVVGDTAHNLFLPHIPISATDCNEDA